MEVPFTVQMNPNYKGITAEDLQKQFELASAIRDKTSETNLAVIRIRQMRDHIRGTKNEDVIEGSKTFIDGVSAIEQELYQVKNQSSQDPLNFPIKLNNRFASLRRSVENGDARPTDGAYKVFEELKIELEGHLTALEALKNDHLSKINDLLKEKGFDPIN